MTKTEALQALHDATGGDLYDAVWEGGQWMHEATETADTLDQFVAASEGWREVGTVRECRVAGLRCVYFGEVQVRKGDPRRELAVIDLGDVRVAVAADVSEWAE
jgi:hypothetical protein